MSLAEEHVREFARSAVRSGLLDERQLHAEVSEAVTAELPASAERAGELADAWVAEFREELARDQRDWPEVTDYDRLQAAFAELEGAGVAVLQGCEDHWAAKRLLDESATSGRSLRGVAWFTPPDVWHAVDEGMLEVNVWHSTTANVAPGDELLADVVAVLERHGIEAHYDEGRVEVATYWRRRLTGAS